MDKTFKEAVIREKEKIRAGDRILQKARTLYLKGYHQISPAQMAGVGQRLQSADTLDRAKKDAVGFLTEQRKKLKARAEKGKRESWYIPAKDEGESDLGKILGQWIEKEKYLQEAEEKEDASAEEGGKKKLASEIQGMTHPDRLAALRRFWSYVQGMHSFKKVFDKDMTLKAKEEGKAS